MVPLCVLILLAQFAAISYPPPTILTGGLGPSSVAVGDFNHDFATDFATADQFANSVTVRFGSGGGAFPTLSTITGFVTPMAIVSADFNNDGVPDPRREQRRIQRRPGRAHHLHPAQQPQRHRHLHGAGPGQQSGHQWVGDPARGRRLE